MIVTATSIQVVVPGSGEGRPAPGPADGEADFAALLSSLAPEDPAPTAVPAADEAVPVAPPVPGQDRARSDDPGTGDRVSEPIAIQLQASPGSIPEAAASGPDAAPAVVDGRSPGLPRRIVAVEGETDLPSSPRPDPAIAGRSGTATEDSIAGRVRMGTGTAVQPVPSAVRIPARPTESGPTDEEGGNTTRPAASDVQVAHRTPADLDPIPGTEPSQNAGRSPAHAATEPLWAPAVVRPGTAPDGEGRDRVPGAPAGEVVSQSADPLGRDGRTRQVPPDRNAPVTPPALPDSPDPGAQTVSVSPANTLKAPPDQTLPGPGPTAGGQAPKEAEIRKSADPLPVRPRPEPATGDGPETQAGTAKTAAATRADTAVERSNPLPEGHGRSPPEVSAAQDPEDASTPRSPRPEAPDVRSAAQPPAAAAAAPKAPAPNSVPPGSAELTGDRVLGDVATPDVAAPSDTSPSTTRDPAGTVAPAQPSRADIARAVVDQLAQAIRTGGDGSIDLQLSPEELGRVRLTLSLQDGDLFVAISTDRIETLDLMRRHIDLLARDFREQGYASVQFSFGQGGRDGAPNRNGRTPSEPDTAPPALAAASAPGAMARPERPARPPGTDRLDLRL